MLRRVSPSGDRRSAIGNLASHATIVDIKGVQKRPNHRNHYLFGLLKKMVGRVDVLINTSFNVAGDPIVFDIIDCFTNMKRLGLKYLVTEKGLFEIVDDNS